MSLTFKSYIFIAALFLAACKKDGDGGYSHNPSAPIVVNTFSPMQGATGTDILITGSNFSSDTTKVKVSINGVPLKIVGAKEDRILAFLPAKTGSGPITVTIGENSATSTDQFTYQFSYVVTTLAGSGSAGYQDGKGEAASFNFDGVRSQLSVDDNLNVYVPDGGNQRIRKIAPDGTVTTLAGSGVKGFEDGPAALAKFNNPCGTTVDANGNVYVSERNGNRIRKITPDGTVSTYVSGPNEAGTKELTSVIINKNTGAIYWSDFYGDGVYTLKNGNVTRVIKYSLPCTITMDNAGNIYSTHYDAQTVRKYTYNAADETFDNGVVIAGKNAQTGWEDGIGESARFNRPWGIAIDNNGNLLVSGLGEHRNSNNIRHINTTNNMVTTIAGVGDRGYADGKGNNARFDTPTGIAVDKNGDMYVLDLVNQRIRKITVQ